jgi:hypothetical protein
MFDKQNIPGAEPPPNLPFEADDMLAGVEKDVIPSPENTTPNALSAGVLKKKTAEPATQIYEQTASSQQSEAVSYGVKKPVLGKILASIFIILFVGGVVFGSMWMYTKYFKTTDGKKPNNEKTNVTTSTTTTNNPLTSTSTDKNNSANDSLFSDQVDSDKDNLTDDREFELGTNQNKPDTDGEGLNDGDEVLIWRTDPRLPDTDGDGYKDGEEVKNGYNPLGQGRLLESGSNKNSATSSSGSVVPPAL